MPFEATHYNTDRFGRDITRLAAPPYDVIDQTAERRLKDDRLNITHITLGDEHDSYAVASKRLRHWLNDEVMVRDKGEAFYVYEQTFESPDGSPRVRSGIVGLVLLEEFSKGIVMPHENTIPKHKADRLALMSAVCGDTEQIFMLYDDPTGGMERLLAESRRREELLRFVDVEGVHHRILRIDEPEAVRTIASLMEPTKLLIADGHHRYETSLEYRDARRKQEGHKGDAPYDYVMATLVSFRNPGLVIFPTHRLVKGVALEALTSLRGRMEPEFVLEDLKGPEELVRAVDASGDEAFGVWIPSSGTAMMATPKEFRGRGASLETLSVSLLQEKVLKKHLSFTTEMLDKKIGIEYVKGTPAAKELMETGEFQACFFVKPPTVEQVMAVAQAGLKMPHKSTYFFPKIWSGTLLHLFDR
jgi:uncharacterized protein (DUF1015 family)